MQAAAQETKVPDYHFAAQAILGALERLQNDQGVYPIVGDEQADIGQHPAQESYAYLSVYNAHCTAWLARSLETMKSDTRLGESPLIGCRLFSQAGLASVRKENYTVLVSSGRGGNSDSALSMCSMEIGNTPFFSMVSNQSDFESVCAGHIVRLKQGSRVLATTVGQQGHLELKQTKVTGVVGEVNVDGIEGSRFALHRSFDFLEDCIRICDIAKIHSGLGSDCYLEMQLSILSVNKSVDMTSNGDVVFSDGSGSFIRCQTQTGKWKLQPETLWCARGATHTLYLLLPIPDSKRVSCEYYIYVDQ
jgi:hypothetical protein